MSGLQILMVVSYRRLGFFTPTDIMSRGFSIRSISAESHKTGRWQRSVRMQVETEPDQLMQSCRPIFLIATLPRVQSTAQGSTAPVPIPTQGRKHFIANIIEEDLKSGKHKSILTRFPPVTPLSPTDTCRASTIGLARDRARHAR